MLHITFNTFAPMGTMNFTLSRAQQRYFRLKVNLRYASPNLMQNSLLLSCLHYTVYCFLTYFYGSPKEWHCQSEKHWRSPIITTTDNNNEQMLLDSNPVNLPISLYDQ